MFPLLLVLLSPRALALCPATPESVESICDDALSAYENLDLWGFRAMFEQLSSALSCLSTPVDPGQALKVHQTYALAAWVDEDHDGALSSWRASVTLAPEIVLSEDIAPSGSRIRALYESARMLGPGTTQAVNAEDLVVDGEPSRRDIPIERASLVQRNNTWGTESWYLRGEIPQDLRYEGAPTAAIPVDATALGTSPKLLIGAGSSALGSLIAMHIALNAKRAYYNSEDPTAGDRYHRHNQVAGLGAYTLGATSLGLTTTALLMRRW